MAKINWGRALVDYIYNETASYASIALKHGVSLQAVKKRASRDKWQEIRKQTIQKVDQKLPEKVGETLAEVNARHAEIAKQLIEMGTEPIENGKIEPRNFREAVEMIIEGIKIERQALSLDKLPSQPQAIQIRFGAENLDDKKLIENWERWAK